MTPLKMDPQQTAQALPFMSLSQAIKSLLQDTSVVVPPRLVQPLSNAGSLFGMPAADAQLAITKLITWVADNPSRGLVANGLGCGAARCVVQGSLNPSS